MMIARQTGIHIKLHRIIFKIAKRSLCLIVKRSFLRLWSKRQTNHNPRTETAADNMSAAAFQWSLQPCTINDGSDVSGSISILLPVKDASCFQFYMNPLYFSAALKL